MCMFLFSVFNNGDVFIRLCFPYFFFILYLGLSFEILKLLKQLLKFTEQNFSCCLEKLETEAVVAVCTIHTYLNP